MFLHVAIPVLLLAAELSAQAKKGSVTLPEGEGRDMTQKLCGRCHDVGVTVARRRTRMGWERSIIDMVQRGAPGSEDELETVLTYLSTQFGRIDVNSASVEEMKSFLGLPEEALRKIVAGREKRGPFKSMESLKEAVGAAIEEKRHLIAFEP